LPRIRIRIRLHERREIGKKWVNGVAVRMTGS
jgi:hypothetical protein